MALRLSMIVVVFGLLLQSAKAQGQPSAGEESTADGSASESSESERGAQRLFRLRVAGWTLLAAGSALLAAGVVESTRDTKSDRAAAVSLRRIVILYPLGLLSAIVGSAVLIRARLWSQQRNPGEAHGVGLQLLAGYGTVRLKLDF